MKSERGKETTKMKKLIAILITIIALALLSSCIKIYMPENPNIDTDITNEQTDTDKMGDVTDDKKEQTPEIVRVSSNKDVYPYYNLGSYRGNGFKLETVTPGGLMEYEIIQNYEEALSSTENGSLLDKNLFSDHYILVVRFPYVPDKSGFVGLKNLRVGTGGNMATLICSGTNIPKNEYFYFQVPKKDLEGWYGEGTIQIRTEKRSHVATKQIAVQNDFIENDGEVLFLSRDEVKAFLKDNELSVKIENVPSAQNYIVFFSKLCFDTPPSFVEPTFNDGTISLIRDLNISSVKKESAYIDVIPLNVAIDDKSTVKKIEIASYQIGIGANLNLNYQANSAVQMANKNVSFYKTFNGGVYYGTELADKQSSAYTVIENYNELLSKTEFYIDKEILKDNYIIVLKLVNVSGNRLGFTNARTTWIDTIDGEGLCTLNLQLYITPYYNEIIDKYSEQLKDELKDKIDELEQIPHTVEYQYIVVPRSHLRSIAKTGDLYIDTVDTFNNNDTPTITKKYLKTDIYNLAAGDTWRITTKVEMEDFNKKYGTNFPTSSFSSREYIIVYLTGEYEIHQSSLIKMNNSLYLYYLAGDKLSSSNKNGYFLCIKADASQSFDRLYIEHTVISSLGSYSSYSVEQNIYSYDFYSINLSYSKTPELDKIVLTEFSQFEEIFNQYKHGEYESITAEMIFNPSTFKNNYVVVFNMLNSDADVFYNARVSGENILYLYAYEESTLSDGWDENYLHFISIPKYEISKAIKGVKIQYTKEPVFNGPFENVVISSKDYNDVKLEKSFTVISSYDELKALVENYDYYEKLRAIDFNNNIILAFNRKSYSTDEYLYGAFVNFKTNIHGTATITYMTDGEKWLSNGYLTYVLDLIIIPKEYVKHELEYFHVRYNTYSEAFEPSELDRIDYPDYILPEILPDRKENLE